MRHDPLIDGWQNPWIRRNIKDRESALDILKTLQKRKKLCFRYIQDLLNKIIPNLI